MAKNLKCSLSGNLMIWEHPTQGRIATMDLTRLPGVSAALQGSEIVREALLNGLSQTVSDAGAMKATDAAGNIIPAATRLAMRKERMLRRIETLYSGVYAKQGSGASESSLLYAALERIAQSSQKAAAMLLRFSKLTDEEKKRLRESPKMLSTMNEIRAERAPAGGEELFDDDESSEEQDSEQ